MSRIHAPHVEGHFGADASDTLLCAAVYLGMFENRLMNASKLADYVGVPRSTMDLEELEWVGRVERRGPASRGQAPFESREEGHCNRTTDDARASQTRSPYEHADRGRRGCKEERAP
jgi:hypothetical protein